MAYNLRTTGVADFNRLDVVLAQRKIARDPLVGVVDGANRSFFTNYRPILTSGSLTVYQGLTPMAGVADYDTGEITTGSAPAVQPVATYTYTPYTTPQTLSLLINGFHEMERRFPRDWQLLDTLGATADENSDALLIADAGGADPITGRTTQIAFFIACVNYAYTMTRLTGSAGTDYAWRETVRGMSVDKSRMPGNLKLALDATEASLRAALESAQDDWYAGGNMGGFLGNPVTLEYVQSLEWQTISKQRDYAGMAGNWAVFPLTT